MHFMFIQFGEGNQSKKCIVNNNNIRCYPKNEQFTNGWKKEKKVVSSEILKASCPIALLLCVFLFFIFYFSFFIVYLFRKRLQGDELSFKHPCKLQASRNWMTHVNEMLMWIQWNCIGKWGYNVIAFLIYGDFYLWKLMNKNTCG